MYCYAIILDNNGLCFLLPCSPGEKMHLLHLETKRVPFASISRPYAGRKKAIELYRQDCVHAVEAVHKKENLGAECVDS